MDDLTHLALPRTIFGGFPSFVSLKRGMHLFGLKNASSIIPKSRENVGVFGGTEGGKLPEIFPGRSGGMRLSINDLGLL